MFWKRGKCWKQHIRLIISISGSQSGVFSYYFVTVFYKNDENYRFINSCIHSFSGDSGDFYTQLVKVCLFFSTAPFLTKKRMFYADVFSTKPTSVKYFAHLMIRSV